MATVSAKVYPRPRGLYEPGSVWNDVESASEVTGRDIDGVALGGPKAPKSWAVAFRGRFDLVDALPYEDVDRTVLVDYPGLGERVVGCVSVDGDRCGWLGVLGLADEVR